MISGFKTVKAQRDATIKKHKAVAGLVCSAPPLPFAIHASQHALAARFVASEANLLHAKQDLGKTVAMRAVLDRVQTSGTAVFVAISAGQAVKQAVEVGALFEGAYHPSKHRAKLLKALEAGPARIMMSRQTFLSHLDDVDAFAGILGGLGEVILVIDEVHELYERGKYPPRVAKLVAALPGAKVLGLTAELGYTTRRPKQAKFRLEMATTLLGGEPAPVGYEDEEAAAFRAYANPFPPKPAWKQEKLPAPDAKTFGTELAELGDMLVGRMLEPGIANWTAIANLLASILAMQVHQPKGGRLLAMLDGAPFGDGEVGFDSVLVVHKMDAAAKLHLLKLEEVQDTEGVCEFTLHDMRETADVAKHERALAEFTDAYRAQASTTVGFIGVDQKRGVNDFAKNATAIAAVGVWRGQDLRQLEERIGRCTKLEPDDLVPKAYKLVHYASEWANEVDIALKKDRVSMRGHALSDEARVLLERVDDDEKTKALKLAQVPMPGVDLALAYLQQATSPTEEFQERVQELFTLYSSSEWK